MHSRCNFEIRAKFTGLCQTLSSEYDLHSRLLLNVFSIPAMWKNWLLFLTSICTSVFIATLTITSSNVTDVYKF